MDLCDQKLKQIKDQVLACRKCCLHQSRRYPVIGQGDHRARVVFIGEAPGRQEDAAGRPFCGAAGRILDEVLIEIGLKRSAVYITNILKCRPPGNRNPLSGEIEACSPYLNEQLAVIKPKVICSMGNFAAHYILERYGLKPQVVVGGKMPGITRLKGRVFLAKDKTGQPVKIVPLYHPAVATYNINQKPALMRDYRIVAELVKDFS